MTEEKAIMHILSHTHWDREWYQEFQGFRQRLVFQIDALLDLMEKRPQYKYFHMDGQTSCIADYLEIRPENRSRLAKLIESGKILIGPWFVMPDELLLSGESLTRNLLLGRKICREYNTDPMPIGYVTDIFGHCSQLPQILQEFDIDAAILQRGTSGEDGASEIVWEGADGSIVLLVKCHPYGGYGDFYLIHDKSDEEILEYEKRKHNLATTSVLFGMDGFDHAPAQWMLPEILDKFNNTFKKTRCIHSSMSVFLHDLKAALGEDWQETHKRYKGELHVPNKQNIWQEVFQGTGSSRIYLKQANDALEYLLPRCAEPMHVWSRLHGGDDQKSFLNLAWNYMLLNHPHDSIVGCSVDKVHRDMLYRFSEASSIAWNSIWESAQTITSKIDTKSLNEGPVLTVFNMAKTDSDKITQVSFEVPQGVINEKRNEGMAPVLLEEGKTIPVAVLDSEPSVWNKPIAVKYHKGNPKFLVREDLGEIERISAKAPIQIPAAGYSSFKVGFLPANEAKAVQLPEGYAPVAVSANSIENEFFILSANPDGSVNLKDKKSGITYKNLGEIEDCGDVGHGWDHTYPKEDTVIRSSEAKNRGNVSLRTESLSPISAELHVEYSLSVPKGVVPDRSKRHSKRVAIPIKNIYTIDSGLQRIECKTIINNKALNHRMRAIFSTNRKSSKWFCDTAFNIVERDIKLMDTTGWLEPKREEGVIKNFAAVCDKNLGLAIITKGLCEACVQDNETRSIALILFRGFSQSAGSHWTTDSQMQGEVAVEYAVVPFAAENGRPPVALFDEVERYKMPVICYTGQTIHEGSLPLKGRFIDIKGDVVLSTMKTAEGGMSAVIRIFNPGISDAEAVITFHMGINQAWLCNLAEDEISELSPDGNELSVVIPPKKVVTLKVV